MKKLLSIFLLAPLIGMGQNDTTILAATRLSELPDSIRWLWLGTNSNSGSVLVNQNKLDTARCILLVCDTGKNGGWVDSIVVNGKIYEAARFEGNRDYNTYWQFGYEVREHSMWYYPYNVITHLDSNKQPMRKTVVVWQVKAIN